jgi:hypothetical protein
LARNERLVAELAAELAAAEEESKTTGQPARRSKEFSCPLQERSEEEAFAM